MPKIKIGIADDHVLFRKGMVAILEENPDFEVIFEAGDGKELIDLIPAFSPDLILLDLKMPVMNGMEAIAVIRERFDNLKVIALSSYEEESFIIHMMENGVNGYLVKNSDPEEVENSIYSVMENGYYFNDHISKVMLKGLVNKKRITPSFNIEIDLTPREREILELVCQEFTNREISEKLCIGIRTVEGYRNNLLKKVGARNTAGLVVYAFKNGIID